MGPTVRLSEAGTSCRVQRPEEAERTQAWAKSHRVEQGAVQWKDVR